LLERVFAFKYLHNATNKGFYNVSFASIARCGGFIGSFMAIKLIYPKVLLGVYKHIAPMQ
jgi:hypothetical protein